MAVLGKVTVFGQSGFIWAKEVIIGLGGCNRAKWLYISANFVVFGQVYCIMAQVLVFGLSGCIWAQVVVFGQSCCIRSKVVIIGLSCCNRSNWLYFGKSGCIGKIGSIRTKWL